MEERILSLDISTKTGWCLLVSSEDKLDLEAYGQIPKITEPDGSFPSNYVVWAHLCYDKVAELIEGYAPDVLVIEQTAAGSKSIFSQKILEWIHFLIGKMIRETGIKTVYFMTEEWRRETNCYMTKDESKHNKEVKKYKQKNDTEIAYKDGKRVGKITRKHVNIRRANEMFGSYFSKPLRKKDEDLADSLLLGAAYHLRKIRK